MRSNLRKQTAHTGRKKVFKILNEISQIFKSHSFFANVRNKMFINSDKMFIISNKMFIISNKIFIILKEMFIILKEMFRILKEIKWSEFWIKCSGFRSEYL